MTGRMARKCEALAGTRPQHRITGKIISYLYMRTAKMHIGALAILLEGDFTRSYTDLGAGGPYFPQDDSPYG